MNVSQTYSTALARAKILLAQTTTFEAPVGGGRDITHSPLGEIFAKSEFHNPYSGSMNNAGYEALKTLYRQAGR